jgi:hypothetical protein
MKNFKIEINYTDGPIPFQIEKKTLSLNEEIISFEIISPEELYELDRDNFIYYYKLHAFILHHMADRISSPTCDMQELHNNSKKVSKLTKSFSILNNILQVNDDDGK